MSEWEEEGASDSANLHAGISFASFHRQNFGLEVIVLRIIRIALLALVPMVALGTLVTACSDDTTSPVGADLSTTVPHDMAMPVHDLAHAGD